MINKTGKLSVDIWATINYITDDLPTITRKGKPGSSTRVIFYEIDWQLAVDEINYGNWASAISTSEAAKGINAVFGTKFSTGAKVPVSADYKILVCQPIDPAITGKPTDYNYWLVEKWRV